MTQPDVTLIAGGTIVHDDAVVRSDVLVRDGVISEIGTSLTAPAGSVAVDATGCWVGPGFVDLHTHFREPGNEAAETIETGARAGVLGGYSALLAMPNTEPAMDSVALVSYAFEQGAKSLADVAIAGAITIGRQGEQLAPLAKLAALGVRIFTDDGNPVQNAGVMRRALQYAGPLGVTLAQHCEDHDLVAGGTMNEGAVSSRLGLRGRPGLAEEVMVERDIALVRDTKCPLHFLHLSTVRSVELVRAAQAEGLPVTFEIAPHHFTMDDTRCESFDATFKVHPPLRGARDVAGLREALRAGVVDAVATDHAPHTAESKDLPFDEAPPGMLGLEHAAALTLDALGGSEADPLLFFQVLSRGPARIARLRAVDQPIRNSAHGGRVGVGEPANLVVFDPSLQHQVDRRRLASKATNTPYHGMTLTGRARATFAKGRLVQLEGELL